MIDKLELGFMGVIRAENGNWSIATDFLYSTLEDDVMGQAGVQLTAEQSGWILIPSVGYHFAEGNWGGAEVLAGLRYLSLDTDLTLGDRQADESASNWDGIVGVRGIVNVAENGVCRIGLMSVRAIRTSPGRPWAASVAALAIFGI